MIKSNSIFTGSWLPESCHSELDCSNGRADRGLGGGGGMRGGDKCNRGYVSKVNIYHVKYLDQ